MGRPIVYCSKCGAGLREGGGPKEKVYRQGELIFCGTCRPADAVQEASGIQPRINTPSRPVRAVDTPRPLTPRVAHASSSTSSPAPLVLGITFGVVLLVLLIAWATRRPPPPPPPPPSHGSAPAAAPKTYATELAKVDQDLRRAMDREDFRGAIAALEGARARRSDPEWTTPIDERIRDTNARAMALFSALKQDIGQDRLKAAALRARVERWGRRDFLGELDRLLESAPPELSKVDEELKRALDKEDFKGALDYLAGLRPRSEAPAWMNAIDERIRDVNAKAMALFSDLKKEVAKDRAKAAAAKTRVEAWGRADFAAELDKILEEGGPWTSIFNGTNKDFLRHNAQQSWELADGALARREENAAQTSQDFADGEFRFRFSVVELSSPVFFVARQGGGGGLRVDSSAWKDFYRPGQTHEIRFVFRGAESSATFDGRPIEIRPFGKLGPSGALQFNGPPTFRLYSVDFRP
jgi:hypothetical protein